MKTMLFMLLGVTLLAGCKSVYNTGAADAGELAEESSVVVVRPDKYTLLIGTRSMRDYLEVVYEEFGTNAAGQPEIKIGLRNKGGEHWWDRKGPDFTLYATVAFYENPVVGKEVRQPPLYKAPRKAVVMKRGATADIIVTSPVKGAGGYQVTLSEN